MPVSPSGNLQGPPDEPVDPFQPLLEQPASRRFLLFKGGTVLAFGALAVRLWQMQIAEGRQYAALAEQFTEEERVKLTLLINVINGWNRLAVGFGLWIDTPATRKIAA